jgi:hypothetical protein
MAMEIWIATRQFRPVFGKSLPTIGRAVGRISTPSTPWHFVQCCPELPLLCCTSHAKPPPWRRQETFSERPHRDLIENCGSWVGE